jgi:unsaturated rhamnogalacturonyl hydrolase
MVWQSMNRSITVCLALLLVGCNGEETPPFDYCTSDPPDEACYREKRDPGSDQIALAEAIVQKQIAEHPADTLDWDWEEAVLLVGVHELYRITGKTEYRDYYQAWIDHHIAQGYEMKTSDTSAPARLAQELYAAGQQQYRQVIDDFFIYINEDALRTKEGGLNHLGTDDTFGITLWVDSLFMFGGVLIRWGEEEGDQAAIDEFAMQHTIFTDLLQKEPGWYKHAHDWLGNQDEDVYWGRGNGWVAAATADYLRVLLARGEKDKAARQALEKLFAAIISTQDSQSGLWWTVVNRPGETYLETSASALFAYSLARAWRYGFADDSVLPTVEQAVAGVRAMIQTDAQDRPVVTGISGPTMAGSFEYYRDIPVLDDLPFGLGAVLLMLIETSGLP